ncbi:DUF3710 domain-containing protein [Actinomyces faecalis]|uniref:DUF3710 domain-containing protein n=1 Tax=Actinomyces faecalis TaxID=2722820 RepID=UPI00155617FD|nr:DUF3710 domain-containing protein [Actinomyces faecalis]
MGLFSRRSKSVDAQDSESQAQEPLSSADEHEQDQAPRPTGPWDAEDAPEVPAGRVDLGSLQVPAVDGMQLRLDSPGEGQAPSAVVVVLAGSALELRAFAAPRSAGVWDELREDITAELSRTQASYRIEEGPHGPEVLAQVTTQGSQGPVSTPVRFIGVDGPRWFLRGVLQGPAATDNEAATRLREVLDDVVVVRDGQARPPRELLPLQAPQAAAVAAGETRTELEPLEPGPTVAEVR